MSDRTTPPGLRFLPPGAVTARGWIDTQLQREADGYVGRLDELAPQVGGDAFAGRVASTDTGTSWWNGESEGNWADALMRLAAATTHTPVERKAAAYTARILATQGLDGYLGVYTDEIRRARPGRLGGDLWTQSRVLSALLVRATASGDPIVFAAACRAARQTVATYDAVGWGALWQRDDPDNDGGRAHGQMIVEPLLELYAVTDDKLFLDAARSCYDAYSASDAHWGVDDCRLPRLLDPAVAFHSHGVHTCELLRLPLLLHEMTGDPAYAAAAEAGYAKMAANVGVTGACKSDEFIGAEGVGGVPLPGAGYEACTITELLFSLHERARILGDMAAADAAEHLLFNAGEGQSQADGRAMSYLSAANLYAADDERGWQWAYSPTHRVVCCAPNLGRMLPGHTSRMVAQAAGGGLTVLFYGPSVARTSVGGVDVVIEQDTEYPFADEVRLRVRAERPHPFPLTLRIPGWTTGAGVAGMRRDARVTDGNGALTIDQTWQDEEILLTLPTAVRVLRAVDGTAAVARGPLVFALPIAGRTTVVKEYPVAGFADTHVRPDAGETWDVTLQLDLDDPGRFFEVVRRPLDGVFPWAARPLTLRTTVLDPRLTQTTVAPSAREVELVPFGSTTLRRTTFPWVDRTARPLLPPAEW